MKESKNNGQKLVENYKKKLLPTGELYYTKVFRRVIFILSEIF